MNGGIRRGACAALLATVGLAAGNSVLAATHCRTDLVALDGPTGYQDRGSCCEGLYEMPVSLTQLSSLSLLGVDLALAVGSGGPDSVRMKVLAPVEASISLHAVPVQAYPHYRLDATIDSSRTFLFLPEVAKGCGVDVRSLRFLATSAAPGVLEVYPIMVDSREVPTPSTTVSIVSGVDLDYALMRIGGAASEWERLDGPFFAGTEMACVVSTDDPASLVEVRGVTLSGLRMLPALIFRIHGVQQ